MKRVGIGLHVIATDEELMIARHTLALLAARGAQPVHAS
jgi:acetate kinase